MAFCPDCKGELKKERDAVGNKNEWYSRCYACGILWRVFIDPSSGKVLSIRKSLNQDSKAG